jgi:GNAT superfamily N-acetyltransferase
LAPAFGFQATKFGANAVGRRWPQSSIFGGAGTRSKDEARQLHLPQGEQGMRNITIQEAAESDLADIVALLDQLIKSLQDSENLEPGTIEQNCRILMVDPAVRFLIAKEDRQAIGFINFSLRRTTLHPGPSGLIDELVVAESHRGQGVGRLLVEACITECRKLGCSELEVSTKKSNNAARSFYKRCGFEDDAVLLEIDLYR